MAPLRVTKIDAIFLTASRVTECFGELTTAQATPVSLTGPTMALPQRF
jgi:hypothetical protein